MTQSGIPEFQKAKNAATNLLLYQDIHSLKIVPKEFDFGNSIILDTLQNYSNIVGCRVDDLTIGTRYATIVKVSTTTSLILYNGEETNYQRMLWDISHELGHCYLNHWDDTDKSEVEANFFAAQLLMPEIVLDKMKQLFGELDEQFIMDYFNVNYTAAHKRIKNLSPLKRSYNKLDYKLLMKFLPILFEEAKEDLSIRESWLRSGNPGIPFSVYRDFAEPIGVS